MFAVESVLCAFNLLLASANSAMVTELATCAPWLWMPLAMALGKMIRYSIVVEKEGVPRYTEAHRGLVWEFRNQRKSVGKKQGRFTMKLIDGLHGEVWRACQQLARRKPVNACDQSHDRRRQLLSPASAGLGRPVGPGGSCECKHGASGVFFVE